MNPQTDSLRPFVDVAVVMRREAVEGPMRQWQPWRWVLDEVLAHEAGFGTAPRLLHRDERIQRWLHPGLRVELFKHDAEGYALNAGTPAPCWFVMWRLEDEPGAADLALAVPQIVSLSYHDAGRWLDAQETVEQVPAAPEVVDWMRAFAQAHHTPEPKRRQRPMSFQRLQDRFGNPASVSTEKKRGGGPGG